jgi:hypothetical protein
MDLVRWFDTLLRPSRTPVAGENLKMLALNHHQTLGVLAGICVMIAAVLIGQRISRNRARPDAMLEADRLVDLAVVAFVVAFFTCFVGELLYSEAAGWCTAELNPSAKAESLFHLPSTMYYLGALWLVGGVRLIMAALPMPGPARSVPWCFLLAVALLGAFWIMETARIHDLVYRRSFAAASILALLLSVGSGSVIRRRWSVRGYPPYLAVAGIGTVAWLALANVLFIHGSYWGRDEHWSPLQILGVDCVVLTLALGVLLACTFTTGRREEGNRVLAADATPAPPPKVEAPGLSRGEDGSLASVNERLRKGVPGYHANLLGIVQGVALYGLANAWRWDPGWAPLYGVASFVFAVTFWYGYIIQSLLLYWPPYVMLPLLTFGVGMCEMLAFHDLGHRNNAGNWVWYIFVALLLCLSMKIYNLWGVVKPESLGESHYGQQRKHQVIFLVVISVTAGLLLLAGALRRFTPTQPVALWSAPGILLVGCLAYLVAAHRLVRQVQSMCFDTGRHK